MFKSFFIAAFMLVVWPLAAQQNILRGVVRDGRSGQYLPGATLQVEGTRSFAIADEFGRFMLAKLNSGEYSVKVDFVGYTSKTEKITVPAGAEVTINLEESVLMTDEVIVYATRANENTPTTYTNINNQAIDKQNFGQDLPYLLTWTPSVVTTSDAGTGFGYTGVRIRGSDATSINVTINGIPYNDSESLGTFWVDIPDIASSSESIQIQRGVGTSSNGAGAFGATINLQTNVRNDQPYLELTNSVGFLGVDKPSYNSRRHTVNFGTGLLNNHWVFDGRLSRIASNGFIDRATADLQSYYFSTGYYAGNTMVKAIMFGGKERTYQAWYGVPESRLNNDVEKMYITAMNEGWNEEQTIHLLNSDNRTFNPYTYPNQVDDYDQNHYQVHFSQRIAKTLNANVSLHYTPGKGYYEEFRYDDELSNYGLEPIVIGDSTISSMNLVRRRWLDNDFYGFTYALNYLQNNLDMTFGGGWNQYDGRHFGELIWSEVATVPTEYQYYFNSADKRDFNAYLKTNYQFLENLNGYVDLQVRTISYSARGLENNGSMLGINEDFLFFNPKFGLVFSVSDNSSVYGSLSVANREPVRSDFVNAPTAENPRSEKLFNFEGGYRFASKGALLNINIYAMEYEDQLIHTGRVNDVGAPIRTNVSDSYRRGIELEGVVRFTPKLSLNANLTLSRNRITEFNEILYDYGTNFDENKVVNRSYQNTTIAFSPSVIAGSSLVFRPVTGLEAAWLFKYVGRQYLDNTTNKARSLDPYTISDLRVSYTLKPSFMKEFTISLYVNNLLDHDYESNGYTWGYLGGGEEYRENYYFPQAGINFMTMVSMKF